MASIKSKKGILFSKLCTAILAYCFYLCIMKMKQFIAVAVLLTTSCITNAQSKMGNVLSKRQQNLAAIACLEAKGDVDNLSVAIGKGLDDGLTVNEIKEALSQLYAYTGFPRSLNGLGTLQRVVDERKAEGKNDETGKDADPLPGGYDALKQGTKVQTQLTGQPFTYTFAPATDYYLKAHLFGDIFARDNLTFADRELVTVSALSGLKGVAPQLKAHVGGARNMGLSDAEIHAIPVTLGERVGDTESYRAAKAIAEVYGESFKEGEPVENMIFPKGRHHARHQPRPPARAAAPGEAAQRFRGHRRVRPARLGRHVRHRRRPRCSRCAAPRRARRPRAAQRRPRPRPRVPAVV